MRRGQWSDRSGRGYTPAPGVQFQFITFGSRTGTFASVVDTNLADGIGFDTTYNATNVTLASKTVVPQQLPGGAAIFSSQAIVLPDPVSVTVRLTTGVLDLSSAADPLLVTASQPVLAAARPAASSHVKAPASRSVPSAPSHRASNQKTHQQASPSMPKAVAAVKKHHAPPPPKSHKKGV